MHLECYLCWKFTWNFVELAFQGRDGWRNWHQKLRIRLLLIVFDWQVCIVLFVASGWRLRCGTVTSTRTIIFQMPPLLMLQCYIMLSNKKRNKITYLWFINHQAVKIWRCTFTPKIHKSEKNRTSPYNWKKNRVSSPSCEQWKYG